MERVPEIHQIDIIPIPETQKGLGSLKFQIKPRLVETIHKLLFFSNS